MIESLKQLRDQALKELSQASTVEALDEIVLKFFGRKQGKLTHILRSLKNMDERQRKILGSEANEVKIEIWKLLDQKRQSIKNSGKEELVDLTVDGAKQTMGRLHPLTQVRRDMQKVFQSMGFAVIELPLIDSDHYNFNALNIPDEHPARDMMDTFYIKDHGSKLNDQKLLLRTHISTIQSRLFEIHKPPFAAVSFGRVFRREATDARHEHTYDSCEGVYVGENVSLSDLKGCLSQLFKLLFGSDVEMKFRISYFPFTEPSVEIIMSCIFCKKKGCSVCHTGWLEMGGAGMTHPNVYETAGYPKGKYTGFAFGLGVSRIAMLKYNIPDIRMLYQNDIRFLNQF